MSLAILLMILGAWFHNPAHTAFVNSLFRTNRRQAEAIGAVCFRVSHPFLRHCDYDKIVDPQNMYMKIAAWPLVKQHLTESEMDFTQLPLSRFVDFCFRDFRNFLFLRNVICYTFGRL